MNTNVAYIAKNDKSPIFKLSTDCAALIALLDGVTVGETVTYERLSRCIGRDIRSRRHSMDSARAAVLRDKNKVFDVVRKVGLIRLSDSQIVDLSDQARLQARNGARRISKKLSCVDFATLTNDKKLKHNAALSLFGAMHELTSTASLQRLTAKVTETGASLPAAKASMTALSAII